MSDAADCQFNCRAKRKADFEAGWKAAQANEAKKDRGEGGTSRHDAFSFFMLKMPYIKYATTPQPWIKH